MATTSFRLAAEVVSALAEVGCEFAVLHGEEALAIGEVGSDIDLVVSAPLGSLLRPMAQVLHSRDIHPIIHWPYDVGGTATTFFADCHTLEGVQIDALYDPDGKGKLGIRSNALLARSEPGRAWPRLELLASLLYQIRKRHWKRQDDRIPRLVSQLDQFADRNVDEVVSKIFDPVTGRMVRAIVSGEDPNRFRRESLSYRSRNLTRRIRRLGRPIGCLAEFIGPSAIEAADVAADRLARFLPATCRCDRPSGVTVAPWYVRRVAPVRWRPGVAISVGGGRRPMADILIEAGHDGASLALRELVHGLAERAMGNG